MRKWRILTRYGLGDARGKKKQVRHGAQRFLEDEADEASDYSESDMEDGEEHEIKDHDRQYYRPEELERKFDNRKVVERIQQKAEAGQYEEDLEDDEIDEDDYMEDDSGRKL